MFRKYFELKIKYVIIAAMKNNYKHNATKKQIKKAKKRLT